MRINSNQSNNQPSNDEMLNMVENSIDGLDKQRAQSLQRLQTVQGGRNSVLIRERARLEQKYGSDDPRVQKLSNRIQYNQGAAQELNTEVGKANIIVPNFDTNTWMVHGLVIEAEGGSPVQGLTVSLYNAKGQWISELGYSCTDENGYYSLKYTKDVSMGGLHDTMDRQAVKAAKETGAEETKDPTEGLTINTNIGQTRDGLYLTVTDQDHQVIHTEKEPVQIKQGQIDYRLIILKQSQCNPPGTSDKPVDSTTWEGDRNWVVQGGVKYDDNTPAANVSVSLYDKDHIFDDMLGTVTTDDNGEFTAEYHEKNFLGLFKEKPDLYLKVFDEKGRQLYRSREAMKSADEDIKGLKITARKKEG